jgi:hypothetical protein
MHISSSGLVVDSTVPESRSGATLPCFGSRGCWEKSPDSHEILYLECIDAIRGSRSEGACHAGYVTSAFVENYDLVHSE